MKRKGWFAIPGVQLGDRTAEEQQLGLERAFQRMPGKSVLDLGCAEGVIAQACLRHGARRVIGMDNNAEFIRTARELLAGDSRAELIEADLNAGPDDEDRAIHRADVVLALAIFHKLKDPAVLVPEWADLARELLVVRLPIGSTGAFPSKYRPEKACNLLQILPRHGFTLGGAEKGPRGEWVQYWDRAR